MSLRSRNAILDASLWTIVLIVYFILFFNGNNPLEWGVDKTRRFISALVFAFGYIGHIVILLQNKKEVLDERTKQVQLQSTNTTIIVSLMYVFVFCITLFTIYESDNVLPVSWLWFIAYTTVFFTFITNSLLYYLMEKKEIGYED